MVHFRTPKVSLPSRCAARGGPGGAWSTPELRCTIHSTVLSCHCLPPSRCPPPPSPLCPAQSEGQTWARINTVRWLPFTFLSALGAWRSTCGRMWCGQSPLEAAVPRPWPTLHHPCLLLGSGQHIQGRRVLGRLCVLLTRPSPMTSPYCYLGSGARRQRPWWVLLFPRFLSACGSSPSRLAWQHVLTNPSPLDLFRELTGH